MFYLEVDVNDQRAPAISYLRNPSGCTNNALKLKTRKYVLLSQSEECLFKRGAKGLLLKCIIKHEALQVLVDEEFVEHINLVLKCDG